MKKKLISLALSLLLFGTMFGAAACETLGGSGSGNGGNNDTPGSVITDEETRGSLFNAIAQAQAEGLTFSAGADLSVTAGEERAKQKVVLEGAARLSDGVEADVYAYAQAESGEEKALQYLLCFLREDGLYLLSGDEEGDKVDFSALKEELRAEQPSVLEKEETGVYPALVSTPAAGKLLKNLAALFQGVAVKTEGGYTLTFDLFEGLGGLLDGAAELLGNLEKNAEMTVTSLFTQPFLSGTLTKLLNGITAKELYEALKALPEEALSLLPAAGNGSAEEYVRGLLISGSFYENVTKKEGEFANYKTFGEVPVKKLVELITGEEVDFADMGLKNTVTGLRTKLKNTFVSLLLPLLSLEGKVENENAALSVQFSFDNDKKLVGFSLDALAEGDIVPETEESEPQPDGGTDPEDGGGDEMALLAGEAEGLEGQKQRLSVSLKLAATFANSPELFDLKGCKYRDGESEKTIS